MKEKMMINGGFGSKRRAVERMLICSRGVGLSLGLGSVLIPAFGQGYFPTVNPFIDGRNLDSSSGDYQPGIGAPVRVREIGVKEPQEYDIKLGPILANFTAGLTFTYQSNFNQVGSQGNAAAQDLFTLGPTVGTTLQYQISDTASLTLGAGVTYQKSIGQLQYDQVSLAPNSALKYQFSVEDVRISLTNDSSTTNQATSDPTISGTGLASLMEFNRLSNSTGLMVAWPFLRDTTLGGGYSYNINNSIGKDNFQQFDSSSHLLTLSLMQQLSPVLSLGVVGNGTIIGYDSTSFSTQNGGSRSGQIQNDSTGWSVGPSLKWMVSQAIVASANLAYSSQRFDDTGLIADNSNFSGLTPSILINHQLSRSVSQLISGARFASPGNGSNFTETYTAQYSLFWNFMQRSALNFTFGFNRFAQSGVGFAYVPYDPASPPPSYLYINENGTAVVPLSSAQVGQQYTAAISTTYSIMKNLLGGVSYTFIANDLNDNYTIQSGVGNASFSGYRSQIIVLTLAYQF